MKTRISLLFLTLFVSVNTILAQNNSSSNISNDDLPHIEVGIQTTMFRDIGIGVRFTYNLNRNVALEAESNIFRGGFKEFTNQTLFGVKVGRRFDKFGFFAKARPGFVYENKGKFDYIRLSNASSTDPFPYIVINRSSINFAFDLGGVVEYYASKRISLRLDAGDTMLRMGRQTFNYPAPGVTPIELRPLTIESRTTHNFQLSGGVSFRF